MLSATLDSSRVFVSMVRSVSTPTLLTGTQVFRAQERAKGVWCWILAVLDAEGDGYILDGLDVVLASNLELHGRVDGDGFGYIEACYPCRCRGG